MYYKEGTIADIFVSGYPILHP